MQLRKGDTFKNSVGKQITVKNIHNSGNRVELSCPNWSSTYHHDVVDIIDRIKLGHYTDYVSVNQNDYKYQVGGIFRHKDKTEYQILSINPFIFKNIKSERVFKPDDHIEITYFTKEHKNMYDYVPPQSTTSAMKVWKKEDFLNTKIIVDTPEKSRRFQELMIHFGLKGWGGHSVQYTEKPSLFIGKEGHFSWSDLKYFKEEFQVKEIFYDDIFNNNNNQSINNNEKSNINTNDISSTDLSGIGGKEASTACKYSRTGKTTSSSGYSGNQIKGRTTPIRVGRSEISFQAVSA